MNKSVLVMLISSIFLLFLLFGCDESICGDNICNVDETSYSCPQDCGSNSSKLVIMTNNLINNGGQNIIPLPSNQTWVTLEYYLENETGDLSQVSSSEVDLTLFPPISHNPNPLINPINTVVLDNTNAIRANGNSWIYLQANLKSNSNSKSEKVLVIVSDPEETENVIVAFPKNYYPPHTDNFCVPENNSQGLDYNCQKGNFIYTNHVGIDYYEVCANNECTYGLGKYCKVNNGAEFCSYQEQSTYSLGQMLQNYSFTNSVNKFISLESNLYKGYKPYDEQKQVLALLEMPDHCGGNNNPLETAAGCYMQTNSGTPNYSVVIHEIGHNFATSKGMNQLLNANNGVINNLGFGECVASLPVQYIRAKLRDAPSEIGFDSDSYEATIFGPEQTQDDIGNKRTLELFENRIDNNVITGIHQVMNMPSGDERITGGPVGVMCSLFVTPAAYGGDFNNSYGWELYKRFLNLFDNNVLENFDESKVETYFGAAYSAAIGRNMRIELKHWGFVIDDTYFEEVYGLLKSKIDFNQTNLCNNSNNYEITTNKRIYVDQIRKSTSYILPGGSISLGLRNIDTNESNFDLNYVFESSEPSKVSITGNVANNLIQNYADYTIFIDVSVPELSNCANIKSSGRLMVGDPFLGNRIAFIYPKDIVPVEVLPEGPHWATISVDQLMNDYDLVKVTDVVRTLEENLFNTNALDGDVILMGLMPAWCGGAGQPTGFGVGCLIMPDNQPQWGVVFHELGHDVDNFNLEFGDGYGMYSSNRYYFLENSYPIYPEAEATLAALYAEYKIMQDKQNYGLSTKDLNGITNQFNTDRGNFLNNLVEYESNDSNFASISPNTLDGIFIYLAENENVNRFGWEIYSRFFKIYQNPLPTFVQEPLTAIQYHTYFIAGLSAATGNDLRSLFVNKWNFPIDNNYFIKIYPLLQEHLERFDYPSLDLFDQNVTGKHIYQNGVTYPICGEFDLSWCKTQNPTAIGNGPFEFNWGDSTTSCSWFGGEHDYLQIGNYSIRVRVKNTCGLISARDVNVSVS